MQPISLPKTISNFEDNFKSMGHADLMKLCKSGGVSSASPSLKQIIKYSTPSLKIGRPLGSVMIVMAGQSGNGKSATINTLFNEPELSPTSKFKSETQTVLKIRRELAVKLDPESPPIEGPLFFVDVPGSLDTTQENEERNLGAIRHFRQIDPAFASRKGKNAKALKFSTMGGDIKSEVYPNLILFVVKATDTRTVGTDSFLRKSLRFFRDVKMLDVKNPNLVVVATNAYSVAFRKDIYEEETKAITNILRTAVEEELCITNFPVVFVENCPERYDLKKSPGTDFFPLPDGSLSHYNLIKEMISVVEGSGDVLAKLFLGWYFGQGGREVSTVPIPKQLPPPRTELPTGQNQSRTHERQPIMPSTTMPTFNFNSLGYGYCPVNEDVKLTSLLGWDSPQTKVMIDGSQFTVPKSVRCFVKKSTHLNRISFESKAEYESHKKNQYGIDVNVPLVVRGRSAGRWVEGRKEATNCSIVSLIYDVIVASFKLDDPKLSAKNPDFTETLENLPTIYDDKTAPVFHAFFERWGSHLICEQDIGGSIQFDCTVKSSQASRENLQQIEVELSGIIYSCFAGANYDGKTKTKSLRSLGITNEKLEITGGDPPNSSSLENLKPEELLNWKKSVSELPSELEHRIKLYPYYFLLPPSSPCYEALRKATVAHLGNTVTALANKLPFEEITRENVSNKMVEEVNTQPGPNCFPEGSLVKYSNGTEKFIEDLELGDLLQQNDVSGTPFLTFLHEIRQGWFPYLALQFENGKTLAVSEDHLIFASKNGGVPYAVKAGKFQVGLYAPFITSTGETHFTQCTRISKVMRKGAFAPLTSSGTLIVDGFLVTCYANVDSFEVAQFAMIPLKMYYKALVIPFSDTKRYKRKSKVAEDTNLIHPYANCLMKLQSLFI